MCFTENSINEPIFIVGTPRSGTTLLARILNLHSRIFMPGETHFFDDIYFRRNELGDPASMEPRERIINRLLNLYDRYNEPADQLRINTLIENENLRQKLFKYGTSYKKLLTTFMSTQMLTVDKHRWGNNAPRDIFNIDEIIQFYPNVKVLVCVRDVRAFLLSYKGKWRVTSDSHKNRLKRLYHPIVTSVLWKASLRKLKYIEQLVPKENLMVIRYEDLVTNPKNIITNICDLIGEQFEQQMLSIDANNSSFTQTGSGIFTSSLEKWKSELSPEEIMIAQILVNSEMQYLGYALHQTKANLCKVFIYFISTPWALLQGLRANKDMYGNIFSYLLRRVMSLFSKRVTP